MRLLELIANRQLDGRMKFQGMLVSIENAKGSVRKGVGKDGKPWSIRMTYPYGYIRMTEGVDGDHVDCFIGPHEDATHVYVVHTVEPTTGKYDEDKCMLGFDSADAAKKAFLENYSSPKFFGSMDAIPLAKFKEKAFQTKQRPAKIAASGWKLGVVLELYGGGPGSGCNPDKGKCGRHKGGEAAMPSKEDKKWATYYGYRAMYEMDQNTYWQVNTWLRAGMPKPRTIAQQDSAGVVSAIDDVFATPGVASVVKEPMWVFRGLGGAGVFKKFGALRVGATFKERGYSFTSRSQDIAELARNHSGDDKGVVLSIKLPKGAQYMKGRSDEKELLLNRDATFKVLRKEKGWDGTVRMDVAFVLPKGKR